MLIDVHFVLIPILLFFAALFAAAEASLFSLSRAQLETLRDSRPLTYHRIRRLIFEPDELLSTIIIGNECLNIMIGTFVVALLEGHLSLDPRFSAVLSVLMTAILLLTVSEILPKVLAFRLPVLVASILVWPTSWIHAVLGPVRRVFLALSERLIEGMGVRPSPPPVVSERDFLSMVEVGAESGSLEREEKDRIINVFNFSDLTVGSIMTPWSRVFSLKDNLSQSRLIQEVRQRPFSRIPVVSAVDDRVLGILYTKELLKLVLKEAVPRDESVRSLVFPPHIVSSHKKIAALFREFRAKKVHIALVVDEYGRQVGLVTLEDVLNALFRTREREAVAV